MKQIITILAFFQAIISLGQEVNVNDEIKKDFNDYFNLIAERKTDDALNYINPKLFEIVPKEQMKKNFEAKFGIGNVEFDKTSGFYKIKAEKTIIASSNNELLEWNFVTVDNPKMKALLEKIIPKELLN
jgi:hypothetical protein